MASRTPKSKLQTLKLNRLVPLLLNWFGANARDLPWRRTRDPYAIWVSEIMLQQTQVKTVIPYWERWMRELPTVEAVAKAGSDKIHKLWEGLGYYTRARNLQKAARQIVADGRRGGNEPQIKIVNRKSKIVNRSETPYPITQLRRERHVVACKFPEDFEDVLALPGIGRYTAGAICSIAFNQPTPILDGNVIRVLTRIFGIAENPKERKTNERLWKLAEDLVYHASRITFQKASSRTRSKKDEDDTVSHFNQSLMELGAVVCTPRYPQCGICPAKKLCAAFQEDRVGKLPNLGKGKAPTARRFVAFVVKQNGRFLVRQRPAGMVNAHLWEFPNVEIGARLSEPQHTRLRNVNGEIPTTNSIRTRCGSGDPRSDILVDATRQILGFTPSSLQPLCTVKHSITRYRITLEAFGIDFGGASYTSPHLGPAKSGTRITHPSEIGVWKTPMQLQRLAFSSAHKKVLNQLSQEAL